MGLSTNWEAYQHTTLHPIPTIGIVASNIEYRRPPDANKVSGNLHSQLSISTKRYISTVLTGIQENIMDNEILRQIADIGNSMTTMQDNLRAFQDDMTRRFNSLGLSTNRRLDALETDITNIRLGPLRQDITEFQERTDQRFNDLDADLDQRFTQLTQSTSTRQQSERMTQLLQDLGRQTTCHRQEIETLMNEKTDALRNHFDTTINRFETRLNTRSDGLRNHFNTTINQSETRLNARSDDLRNNFNTTINRFETRLNTRSDALTTRFDTAIDQLENHLNARLDALRDRVDTSHANIRQLEELCNTVQQRLITLNENDQDLLVRIQELKFEVRAG